MPRTNGRTLKRIATPLKLGDHVSRSGEHSVSDKLREAERAIETLSNEFRQHAKNDLTQLRNASGTEGTGTVFEVSHELRGLGGSFGLPLLTQVGSSLCEFVTRVENSNPLFQEVVDLHIATMIQIVCDRSVENDATGQQLVEGLLAARATAERTLGSRPLHAK